MRIQEVMGKTGLSRRTIHYYIDQKLIIPPVNEGNGYHDFTGEDVQKLFIIRKLREAGLSLADIRAILRKPRTTPFYLHKQMNELQTQMLTIQKTISEMDRLSGQLPVCQSLDQHAAAGVRVFIIAAVCRVELAHPAADRDEESGDRMDERLVEETPFFLLYRVRGKRKERSFQFFHKRRISVQFCVSREQRRFIFISR